jgi:hypothetical protein
MGLIDRTIGGRDLQAVASVVLRRFSGEHLDVPFDRGRGESPREILVQIYKSYSPNSAEIQCLNEAIRQILKSVVVDGVNSLPDDAALELIPTLYEIFSFLEDVRPIGLEDCVLEIGIRTLRLIGTDGPVENVTVSFFRAASKYMESDAQIAHICGTALATPGSTIELAVTLASASPAAFATKLLPGFLFDLRRLPEIRDAQTVKIRECVRLAMREIAEREGGQVVRELVKGLCIQVAALAHFPAGEAIHRAVVEGLSLANIPAAELRTFEDTYWDEHPRKDGLADPKVVNQRKELGRRIKDLSKAAFREKVPPIRINSFPYAEGAYLHLLRIALKLGFGIDVDVVPVNYNEVKQALVDGEIDLAAHNPSFYEQVADGDPDYLESPPLIKFSRYDLIASIPLLKRIVLNRSANENVRKLASELLGDRQFKPGPDGNGIEAMQELLSLGRITCMLRSDTHDVAKSCLTEMGITLADTTVVDLGPDEGLEKILDGEVLFYVGGALQSHYGTSICASRAKSVLHINDTVYVHFYISKKVYEANRDLYDLILKTWQAMPVLWEYLISEPQLVPRNIAGLIASLREDILVSLNRDRGIQIGFSPSFQELRNILVQHDKILKIEPNRMGFAVRSTEKVSYLHRDGNNAIEGKQN